MPTPGTILTVKKRDTVVTPVTPNGRMKNAIAPHIKRIVDLSVVGYGDAILELNINLSKKQNQNFKLNCQLFNSVILDLTKKRLLQNDTGLAIPQGATARRHRVEILLDHCTQRVEQWLAIVNFARQTHEMPVMGLKLYFKFHWSSLSSSHFSLVCEDRLMFAKPDPEEEEEIVKKIGRRDTSVHDFPPAETKFNPHHPSPPDPDCLIAQTLTPILLRGFEHLSEPGARRQQLSVNFRCPSSLSLCHGLEFFESHPFRVRNSSYTPQPPKNLPPNQQAQLINQAAVVVADWLNQKTRTSLTLLFEPEYTKIEHVGYSKIRN